MLNATAQTSQTTRTPGGTLGSVCGAQVTLTTTGGTGVVRAGVLAGSMRSLETSFARTTRRWAAE